MWKLSELFYNINIFIRGRQIKEQLCVIVWIPLWSVISRPLHDFVFRMCLIVVYWLILYVLYTLQTGEKSEVNNCRVPWLSTALVVCCRFWTCWCMLPFSFLTSWGARRVPRVPKTTLSPSRLDGSFKASSVHLIAEAGGQRGGLQACARGQFCLAVALSFV